MMADITGNQNIIIQGVNENTITLSINGEVSEIKNQLAELKALLQNHQTQTVQYADKIYNIGHIDEANFGVVLSKYVFNSVITKELMKIIPNQKGINKTLESIPEDAKDTWVADINIGGKIRKNIQESYVWMIAWELRRLFAFSVADKVDSAKINGYIMLCIRTYRLCLQLLNAILLSKLWDFKKENPMLVTNQKNIRKFFMLERALQLSELRDLFYEMRDFYEKNGLNFPVSELENEGANKYLDINGTFYQACKGLENLEKIQNEGAGYDLGLCHSAEIHLASILSMFPSFARYKLYSMKKIEYENIRYHSPKYIKDFSLLGAETDKLTKRYIKYDNKPTFSYVILLSYDDIVINLFPFILDYNALTNETDFQVFVYENKDEWSKLSYYCVNKEEIVEIEYNGMRDKIEKEDKSIDIRIEENKMEQEKLLKLDLVIQQFEDAMNTLLDTNEQFVNPMTDNNVKF